MYAMARRPVPTQPTPARKSAFRDVLRRLRRMYGAAAWTARGTGLDVLVEAMLSQNTNMTNARRGYRQLRRAFPTWTKVLNAPTADVQRQIAVCGLARMRAGRLQALLAGVRTGQPAGRPKMSLDWLGGVDPAAASAYLLSFHGIGPKTAAFTLLFGFDHRVLPIDNGILRVVRRLRLVRATAREVEAEQALLPRIPRGRQYETHVLLFRHAKARCRPRNPKCGECALLPVCPFGQRRVRHEPPPELIPLPPRPKRAARFASAGLAKHGDPARPPDQVAASRV